MATNSHEPESTGVVATSSQADRFTDPGPEEHPFRLVDTDPTAARRAERQVASLFLLSALGTLTFIVCYFVFKPGAPDATMDTTRWSNLTLGLGLGVALFAIGIGAVLWAKTLMPDQELAEDRHQISGSEEDRAVAAEILHQAAEESGIARRPLIRNTLIGALLLAPLTAVLALRDLGPLPGNALRHTMWAKGVRLTRDPEGTPIKAADVTIGSAFHVIPEGLEEREDALEQKAKAVVLLMRLDPQDLNVTPGREDWNYNGIVAYSKICTHVGCPVALYEQQTHHLLCPCHQSTFDLTHECRVIFGPAVRPLPQLPITVDDEGYLVARSDFHEPVGPSFWERG